MSWLSKGITALRARRAYKKEVTKMGLFSKETVKSTTTQNVAVGTAAGGGAVALVLSWIRSTWGLPWDVSADPAVIVVLTAVLGPLAARAFAFWRDPAKKPAAGGGSGGVFAGLVALLCVGLLVGMSGCAGMAPKITSTAPDGTVTTRIDTDALMQLAQAQLQMAQQAMVVADQAVTAWISVQSAIDAKSREEWAARLQEKQAEADARRANVEYWTKFLMDLKPQLKMPE